MTTVKDILEITNKIAPFDLSEDWDNSGLQVGNPDWKVEKVVISLETTQEVVKAARDWNADVILTHHPMILSPIRQIDFSSMPGIAILTAGLKHFSIISAHTNLDKAKNGLNDYFAHLLEIEIKEPFVRDTVDDGSPDTFLGIGRIGSFKKEIQLKALVADIKKKLNISNLRITGNTDLIVKTVAICTGSGGSLVSDFLATDADVYITGDTKYHEARRIEESGRALIDVGHFASEHIVVDLLVQRLTQESADAGFELQIQGFKNEKDPFTIM